MSLSGGRRVSHETQSARLNLQSKKIEKLEVGTLTSGVVTVSDHLYVSGFGIVLEEEAPVFFGQSLVPNGHAVQVAVNTAMQTLRNERDDLTSNRITLTEGDTTYTLEVKDGALVVSKGEERVLELNT